MPEEKILKADSKNENPEIEQVGREELSFDAAPPEKEIFIEGGQERMEGKYEEILSKVSPKGTAAASADEEVALDAKNISATIDEESKIQKLLDLASTKGVAHAVKVARSLNDYYALDQMHDALADKLYQGLLEQGLIHKD
jgi:hypothetical protein